MEEDLFRLSLNRYSQSASGNLVFTGIKRESAAPILAETRATVTVKRVGDFLTERARVATSDPEMMDLFARSAFNRYYYACFHLARDLVAAIHPRSAKANHKQFHETILTKTIQDEIKRIAENQLRKKVIDRKQYSSIISRSKQGLRELAEILRSAYTVRCTADYGQCELVTHREGDFTLDRKSLHGASLWPERAAVYCGVVKKQWERLG